MPVQFCSVCSGTAQWDDSANSVVCIDCGYLEDSSQTVLTNDSDFRAPANSYLNIALNPVAGSTLRASSGRPLFGQSSTSKQSESHYKEMHSYIASVLRSISHSALTERACHLFDLAMQRAKYRWGRQAKLACGACIVIALNESQKGETVATIAVSCAII